MAFIISDNLNGISFGFNPQRTKFSRNFIQVNGNEAFINKSSNIDKDSKGQTRSVVSENKKALNIAVAAERKLSESKLKGHITRESNIGSRSTYATKNRTTLASVNRLRLLRNKRLKLANNNIGSINTEHIKPNASLIERQKKAGIIGN